jgi:hypothetical protein
MKYIPKERYAMVRPGSNTLVLVNIDKFLNRLKKDDPDFYIGADTKIKTSQKKIKKSMDYITNYSENPKMYHPKTSERWDYDIMFEPTETHIYNGKLGVTNGRHRMVALKNLDFTHAYIEVPKEQENIFKSLS